MERKGKIIIGVIIVIVAVIAAGVLILANSDVTLTANDATLTLPNKYALDNKGIASADNVGVLFTPVSGSSSSQEKDFFQAIKDNGKDAGYKNITSMIMLQILINWKTFLPTRSIAVTQQPG